MRSVADFGEISWQLTARRIEELKAEKLELETASDVLKQLTAKESAVAARAGAAGGQGRTSCSERLGANEKDAKDIAEAIDECRGVLAETPLTDDGGVLAAVEQPHRRGARGQDADVQEHRRRWKAPSAPD